MPFLYIAFRPIGRVGRDGDIVTLGLLFFGFALYAKHTLFLSSEKWKTQEIHFSFIGFPCVLPRENESVLVGSAILGACASGDFTSIQVGT